MPKEYIVRLVMDRGHRSMVLLKGTTKPTVIGGITYRPYYRQKFGEIAFCAIMATEQVKGYGTRLMNHLKDYATNDENITHFLTYADNNAVGYFAKQGFTKELMLESRPSCPPSSPALWVQNPPPALVPFPSSSGGR